MKTILKLTINKIPTKNYDNSEASYLKESFEKEGFRHKHYNICRSTPDGRCWAHCIAMHVHNNEKR